MSAPAVGIDLGTTFPCVAVVKNGQVQTIYNAQGHYVTPSWVGFTDEDILVGEPARIAAMGNSKNVVFNAKRLIGRNYVDWSKDYKAEIAHWPFEVVNEGGKPFFGVTFKGKEIKVSPQKISSYILKDLKKSAEDFLQQPVRNAVISVPANFNFAQREATEEAAKLAGFNVLRLCSEPAMAGIMHEALKNIYVKKLMLVFDCGGGTTDVAILSISPIGTYEIMSTAGDMYLGGENLNDRLVNHFLQKLREETEKDFSSNEEAVRRLKKTCEEAKCQLSFAETYTVIFDYQCDPKSWKLTRARFNTMLSDLFERMLVPVKEAIEIAGLTKKDIDEVLLAGGTSRVLNVQTRLASYFEGKPVLRSVNPDQAIAQGAAVMAAALSGDKSSTLVGRQLQEVTPLSLNLEISLGVMLPLVPRNTPLPVTMKKKCVTDLDGQPRMSFHIFEGERIRSSDCKAGYLGTLILDDIPKARRSEVSAELTVSVNASGILKVTADAGGKSASLQLQANRQRDSGNVKAMIRDAENNVAIDALHRQRLDQLATFRNAIYDRKHQEEDKKRRNNSVVFQCDNFLKWIDENGTSASMEQIVFQQIKFRRLTIGV